MATPVNFSALTSISIIGNTDQFLVRLDNSLSGSSGFGRTTKFALLSPIDVTPLSGNWQNTYTVVQANSASWATDSTIDGPVRALTGFWNSSYTSYNSQSATLFNTASSPSQGTVRLISQNFTVLDVDTGLQVDDSPTFTNVTATGVISTAGVVVGTLSACNYIASVNTLNTDTYLLSLSDSSKSLIDTYSTNTDIQVPPSTQTNFTIGTQIVIIQGAKTASNYTRLSAGLGVTVNSFNSSLSTGGDYAAMTLIKTNTDTWYLIGNLK